MVLLAPALLWLLGTAPILLFFYVWRARHKRLVAPSVLLWQQVLQETEHRPSWRLPIRHILLLLELLALALLGMALARPAVSVGAQRQEIVVLDASLAMNAADVRSAPTRFAAGQEIVRQMMARLTPAQTMTLIRAGTLAEVVLTSGDREALRRALDSMHADDSTPALAAAVLLARHQAALSHGAPASLTVITARALPGGTNDPCRGAGLPCGVRRLGTSDDDQAVTALAATCPTNATGDCTVFARIANWGPLAVREPVSLFADGLPLPEGAVYTVGPRSGLDLIFAAPRQAHTVELALGRHDILSADDRRWAVLPRPALRKVLIVSDDPTILDRAVGALPNVQVSDTTPTAYVSGAPTYDVTIYDGWLPDNVLLGNALVINPPPTNTLLPYDHMLRNPAVAAIEERGPLSTALLKGVDMGALVVGAAPALTLPPWATPLVAANDGPLIFAGIKAPPPGTPAAGWSDTSRLVLVGFAPAASNLPRLVAFPLLLAHAVNWLSGTDEAGQAAGGGVTWGVVVALPAGAGRGAVSMRDPAGHAVALTGSPSDGTPLFTAQGSPGDYTLRGGVDQHLVVNPAVEAATGESVTWPTQTRSRALATLVARQEVWWAVVLAVLAVLSLEWWVYARRT